MTTFNKVAVFRIIIKIIKRKTDYLLCFLSWWNYMFALLYNNTVNGDLYRGKITEFITHEMNNQQDLSKYHTVHAAIKDFGECAI